MGNELQSTPGTETTGEAAAVSLPKRNVYHNPSGTPSFAGGLCPGRFMMINNTASAPRTGSTQGIPTPSSLLDWSRPAPCSTIALPPS